MGQPTPPGDIPLIEGLDASWNEFVSAIPEDKRAELGPKLKERVSSFDALKPWEDFNRSGIKPEDAHTALQLVATVDSNPRAIYDAIGKHLGITSAEAKEVVKEIDKAEAEGGSSAELEALKNQIATISQIMLAQRDESSQKQLAAQADAELNREIQDVMKKLGTVPEDEIVMRMLQKGMTAEQAHQEYTARVSEIRKTRPAPYVLGTGGSIPAKAIDPTKLDGKATRNLVAQMLEHRQAENNQ